MDERAAQVIRSPRGVILLAELTGLSVDEWLENGQRSLRKRRPTMSSMKPRLPIASASPGLLDDASRLAASTLYALFGFAWNYEVEKSRAFIEKIGSEFTGAARELVSAPAAAWWWDPVVRDRQTVLLPAAGPQEPPDVDAIFGSPIVLPGRIPTGLETSIAMGRELPSLRYCDIGALSYFNGDINCWQLEVRQDARVYELGSPADWTALCDRYPNVTAVPRDWRRHWGIHARKALSPDWAGFAGDWDGLHISLAGLVTTLGVPMRIGDYATIAEEANCESTIWFRADCFGEPTLLDTVQRDEAEELGAKLAGQ